MERERADRGRVLPQIDALNERLLVGRLVAELAIVEALAARDSLIDGRAVPLELVGAEQIGHHDEPVAPEGGGVGRDFVGKSRHSRILITALFLQYAIRARNSQRKEQNRESRAKRALRSDPHLGPLPYRERGRIRASYAKVF